MKISGKTIIFVGKGKEANFYTASVGSKTPEGEYLNMSLDVIFSKENFSSEQLKKLDTKHAYTLEIEEGFLSVRSYVNKEGKTQRKLVLVVVSAKVTAKTEIKQAAKSEELPF